jgi:hypothetical protein
MKALDILKMYAEKGTEPPPAMMEQLARQAFESGNPNAPKAEGGRGALVQGFIGFLFAGCVFGGLYWWLGAEGFPNWAVYASQALGVFFGFGSFGLLLTALFTRDK